VDVAALRAGRGRAVIRTVNSCAIFPADGRHQTATRTPVMKAKAAQIDRISTLIVLNMIGFSKRGRTNACFLTGWTSLTEEVFCSG
jgi:hypothetical protein